MRSRDSEDESDVRDQTVRDPEDRGPGTAGAYGPVMVVPLLEVRGMAGPRGVRSSIRWVTTSLPPPAVAAGRDPFSCDLHGIPAYRRPLRDRLDPGAG